MENIVSLQQTIKSMSAPYDFFRTPQRKDEDKVKYHARLVVKNTMTTEGSGRIDSVTMQPATRRCNGCAH